MDHPQGRRLAYATHPGDDDDFRRVDPFPEGREEFSLKSHDINLRYYYNIVNYQSTIFG